MELYFKVKKDSKTGAKLNELCQRGDKCQDAVIAFLDKYGFKQYRPSRISYVGGISSCGAPVSPVDTKVWKESGCGVNEWMPKLNCKEGKAIMEEIKSLPIVDIDELNNVVGYEGNHFKSASIGFSGDKANEEYFGFVVVDKWKAKIPSDCVEITASEYKRIFKDKEDGDE
ncbi:hypothetical protein [Bacteroides sp.]|uniref:hypothetical protein n=1 Tax=Bacteroides sp. TaxID=29523 RepID=UPI0026045B43|nr:hypothetical protein [Bacteroides sp.]MDD3037923.1 hypothetical protein [Bacteroides sp.]